MINALTNVPSIDDRKIAEDLGVHPFSRPSMQQCLRTVERLSAQQVLALVLYQVGHAQRNSFLALEEIRAVRQLIEEDDDQGMVTGG